MKIEKSTKTRTTGKGLYKWLKEQKNVKWPKYGGRLVVYLNYKEVDCVGYITKIHFQGRLSQSEIKIRPIQTIHDIGMGAGEGVYLTFSKDATKKRLK